MTEPKQGQPGDFAPPRSPGETNGQAKDAGGETISFEDAIRRLGHIVEQLERGDLPLEASLRLFEEGVGLARISQRRLDGAERRIEELLGVDSEGDAVTRPFEVKLDGG
jgi:exodeoxyribonuclease VII small subunit